MGRLSAGPRTGTSIRFPTDLYRKLKRVADERGTSVNHLVVIAAERYLDSLPPLEPSETVNE